MTLPPEGAGRAPRFEIVAEERFARADIGIRPILKLLSKADAVFIAAPARRRRCRTLP